MRIYISDNIFKSRNVLPKDSSVTLLTRLGLRTTLSPSKHNPLPFPVSSASCEPAQFKQTKNHSKEISPNTNFDNLQSNQHIPGSSLE